MKRNITIVALWLFAFTCLNADDYPSVYDQTIKDSIDHFIREVNSSNVVVVPLSGERHSNTAHIPLTIIAVGDRKHLQPGNIIQVKNRTNFTFIAKDKYPTLRKISAYMDDYYITDDEYEVSLISVFTDVYPLGENKGEKYSRVMISLERLKDKASFGSMSLEDFEYGSAIHEGDIVRLTQGGKVFELVKHKPYPWEERTQLGYEKYRVKK